MPEAAGAQPVKRRPGRPRKSPPPESAAPTKAAEADETPEVESTAPDSPEASAPPVHPESKAPAKPAFPADDRIGQEVDPAWSSISFPDDRQYRIEDGVIVERVR